MQTDLEKYHTQAEPEPAADEQPRSGAGRFLFDLLETLVLSALLFIGINAISARIRVDGSSMEPTLHSGEFVIVNKLAYDFGSPDHGDVVVFHFPRDPDQEYIKRVIGLSGDQIRIEDGNLYVNGNLWEEDYIAASPAYRGDWSVPQGQLFVLGDNRNNSSDSHNWGSVPMENVIGKAFFVYWPPTDWGVIITPDVAIAAP
ncbi:MAG: signal peptidase I [Anaerolineales bacterium]|jgi:signal peptidase I